MKIWYYPCKILLRFIDIVGLVDIFYGFPILPMLIIW